MGAASKVDRQLRYDDPSNEELDVTTSSTPSMFASTVQPGIVSLFSSVGSDPLQIFSTATDPDLPSDSVIRLVRDDQPTPSELVSLPVSNSLSCTVLHIQSPTIKTTFVRCPADPSASLGIRHVWFRIQFREIEREFSFEVGVRDSIGRDGVIRCSTFQDEARIEHSNPLLLHVPLDVSAPSATTPWRTACINLEDAFAHRSGFGKFGCVRYVKVYANCRLRRVWFTSTSDSGVNSRNWELGLYHS